MLLDRKIIAPDQLLVDPNNYRFHNLNDYRPVVSPLRYGEVSVQARAMHFLQSTEAFELQALKDSILTNGYVPLEQIVVEEYDEDENGQRYLVIEGNRRVAAIKSLLDEFRNAVITIPEDKLATMIALPAFVLGGSEDARASLRQTLMAIRHVAGIREWEPYQQAELIAELYEQEEHQFSRVAQRIGIKAREVGRRYRAIKALKQMENDEEFGEHATPKLYAFFHEAVSIPPIKEWLGWSDTTFQAENAEARIGFYELLVSRSLDGDLRQPKIREVRDIRKLNNILSKPLPLAILLDPERALEDAVEAAKAEAVEGFPGELEHAIAQTIRLLKQPGIDSWLNPTERARELWDLLVDTIDRIRPLMDRGE